jgi:hypothetical protein
VLYLLLALGCCTILTAMLLVLQTLNDNNVTYQWISKQQPQSWTSRAAAAASNMPAGGALAKERDFDWVNDTAAAVKFSVKKCAPGCELLGNCNAEEGR